MKVSVRGNPVLVISPPYYRFVNYGLRYLPLGPAYIFSVLQQSGYNAKFYNLDYKRNLVDERLSFTSQEAEFRQNINTPDHEAYLGFERYLCEEKPAAVLINFHSSNMYHIAARMVRIIKNTDEGIVVIAGGVHPTVFPEETIREIGVDVVVRGEGEETVTELMRALEQGGDLKEVRGIVYMHDGRVYSTPERDFFSDLDSLPYPTRYMRNDKEKYNSGYYGTMMISRGCPSACNFCATQAMWKGNVRFRSAKSAVEEIRFVQDRFNTREFTFLDDAFTLNRGLVEEFCALIRKERLNIIWTCLTRADLLDKDIVREMKSAGCYYVLLGIESGDQRILDAMRKKSSLRTAEEKVRMIQGEGVLVRAFFMLGYPGETRESLSNSRELLKKIKPDSGIVFFTVPLPGSKLYDSRCSGERSWDDYNINFPGSIKLEGLCKSDLLLAQEEMFKFINKRRYIILAKLLTNYRYIYNRLLESIFDLPKLFAYLKMVAGVIPGIFKPEGCSEEENQ